MCVEKILHHQRLLLIILNRLHHMVWECFTLILLIAVAVTTGRLELLVIWKLLGIGHLLGLRIRILLRVIILCRSSLLNSLDFGMIVLSIIVSAIQATFAIFLLLFGACVDLYVVNHVSVVEAG